MKTTKTTCGNCVHLFISGMFQDWGGTAGYCHLIKNDDNINGKTKNGIPNAQIKSIKQITDSCDKFELKEQ